MIIINLKLDIIIMKIMYIINVFLIVMYALIQIVVINAKKELNIIIINVLI